MTFDLMWEGTAPAFLEDHHSASHRGRLTTDQTRYSQPGKANGWIALRGQRWTVDEAVQLGVPAPVLSLALYARFASQGKGDYGDKLLAMMRKGFGGHKVTKGTTGAGK